MDIQDTKEQRQAFEAWCIQWNIASVFPLDDEGQYSDYSIHLLYCAWLQGQAAKAQAVPERFEIGRLQDRITELLDERQELYAQLDRTEADSKRINFLADKNQWIANVQLPREIVERNLSSLRNAIDRAMDLAAHGEKQ